MANKESITELTVVQNLEKIFEKSLFEPMDKQTANKLVFDIEEYLNTNGLSYPQFMIFFEGSNMYIKPDNFIYRIIEMANNPQIIV